MRRFIIGSGFIVRDQGSLDFFDVWIDNIRQCKPVPERVIVLSVAGSKLPCRYYGVQEIQLSGDLGHHSALLNGTKKHKFNGWMGTVLALAMIAYNDESDFIFVEQDCLPFGPWVEKMYEEIGSGGVIFGGKQNSFPNMPCSQALFLVKHEYIVNFVCMLLMSKPQNRDNELGESKFARFHERHPSKWKHFSFGYDRCWPYNPDDPVWYIQQVSQSEIADLRQRGKLSQINSNQEQKIMHYKNGREAHNGDKVVLIPSYGPPVAGILYDAVPGNDTCNGKIAITSASDPCPNLKECLHSDDIAHATILDFSIKPVDASASPSQVDCPTQAT